MIEDFKNVIKKVEEINFLFFQISIYTKKF